MFGKDEEYQFCRYECSDVPNGNLNIRSCQIDDSTYAFCIVIFTFYKQNEMQHMSSERKTYGLSDILGHDCV